METLIEPMVLPPVMVKPLMETLMEPMELTALMALPLDNQNLLEKRMLHGKEPNIQLEAG